MSGKKGAILTGLAILGFAGVTLFDFPIFDHLWSIISVKKESETQTAQSRLPLSNIEDETETGIKQPTPINEANKEPETQTPPQETDADEIRKLEFSKLIGILKGLPRNTDRLNFIRNYMDMIPDSLSLAELHHILALFPRNDDKLTAIQLFLSRLPDKLPLGALNGILALFPRSDDKLRVTRIFRSRVEDSYSDSEFGRFKNHYPRTSDTKV